MNDKHDKNKGAGSVAGNGGFPLGDQPKPEEIVQMGYSFMKLMSYYTCAMMELETKFNVLNEEFSLMWDRQPITSVKTRLKDPLSIRNKLAAKGLPFTLDAIEENINDIAGVRVICSFTEDVYMIAEAFKNQDDITVIEEKDYIKSPKQNGYRSLHLIVAVPIFLQHEKKIMRAEIQLRTLAMDFWASLEHQLRYKKADKFDEQMAAELKYCAALSAQLDRKMDELREKVYPDSFDGGEDFVRATLAGLPLPKNTDNDDN